MCTHDIVRSMKVEIWNPIPSAPNYEASDAGRIRSLGWVVARGRKNKGFFNKPGRVIATKLRLRKGKPICCTVMISVEQKIYCRRVHRLVLEAFRGPCPDGFEGCHNDGNPQNNSLSNLRWDTKSANHADAVKHGTFRDDFRKHGEQHHKAMFSESQILEIRDAEGYRGICARLAEKHGCSTQTIYRIRHRLAWKHVA